MPALYVADEDIRRSTNTPLLEVGEKVILFLTQQDRVLDLRGSDFVITGGGPLWGKRAGKPSEGGSTKIRRVAQSLTEHLLVVDGL